MDRNYIITPNGNFANCNELYHWGIKGMKWGVRRYQNEDGSLTASGKKRYLNSDGSLNKAGRKKFGNSVRVEKLNRKSVKDMTDEELDRAIIRARKEDEYNRLRPEPVQETKSSASAKLMSRAVNEILIPAVINSGKTALQNALDKSAKKLLADKVDPNSYEALKKVYDKLKIQKDIDDLKNPKPKELTWDEMLKKQQYEKNERDRQAKEDEAAKEKAKKDAEDRRRREQLRYARSRASENKTKPTYDDFYNKNASRQDEYDWDWGDEVTVEGTPKSSSKSSGQNGSYTYTKSRNSSKSTVDAEGYTVYNEPVSDVITKRNTSSGSEYVSKYSDTPISSLPYRNISGYLPSPKEDDD